MPRIERAWLNERADRQAVAARSLKSFVDRRRGLLDGDRAKLHVELTHATSDDARRAIAAKLAKNDDDRAALDAAWKRSSLRRAMVDSGEEAFAPSVGERRGLATAHAPAPSAKPARDTGTHARSTAKTISGYGAVFDKWSLDLGGFKEKLAPGCFANALRKSDVRCLFNHSADHILARSSSATLELREDGRGLWFSAALLPFDSLSYSLARRISRLDVSQCSFAFTTAVDEWKIAPRLGDLDERTILEVRELFDVSPVVYPAYPQTSCEATFQEREAVPAESPEPERHAPALSQSQYAARANAYLRRYQAARWTWMDTHTEEIERERRYCAAMGRTAKETDDAVERLFASSINFESLFQ